MSILSQSHKISNEDAILTPAMVLSPSEIADNIQIMLAIAGNTSRLRPHIKTHKLPTIIQMQMEAGIEKFKCATLAEMKMLAELGVKDILLAYPLVGKAAIAQFFQIAKAYTDVVFSALVDNEASINRLNESAKTAALQLSVFLDIDNGMHRTGIAPAQAFDLYTQLMASEHLTAGGLHVYDGHIRESDFQERKRHADEDYEQVQLLIDRINQAGYPIGEIICGGSVTFPVHALYPERMLSPGTCLLWDYNYASRYSDMNFKFGALFTTRIISKTGPDLLTLDAGHKAIASEMSDIRVHFFDVGEYERVVHSEEHLVIRTPKADQFEVGDVLYGVPAHICPTMALHEYVYVAEDGRVEDKWQVAARSRIY